MAVTEVSCYEVRPDGYAESTIVDKHNWTLYVERMEQPNGSIKWRVCRYPGQSGMVLTRRGKWIYDSALQKQWTRHTLEEALALAEEHCEIAGPMGWTLQQFEDHFRKKREHA